VVGGILSAFIISRSPFRAPKSASRPRSASDQRQLLVAAAIDRFGWFGLERIPLHWTRVLGIVLLAGGGGALAKQ